MADREKDIRLFFRAASARLEAARFLLEHGFYTDSTYLAGYVVECSLKGLILRRTPRNQHDRMKKELTEVGAKGHDFEFLKHLLHKSSGKATSRASLLPDKLNRSFRAVSAWSTDLRYSPEPGEHLASARFFEAAQAIHEWCLAG
jgi:hypothetical protein